MCGIGLCFLPMHWGKILGSNLVRANNVTNALVDPKSKEPDFKFSAVQVSLYQKPVEKIIIIGAGSAGLGFINSYRALNALDEIHVFSKKRYTLSTTGSCCRITSAAPQTWEQLVKLREEPVCRKRHYRT